MRELRHTEDYNCPDGTVSLNELREAVRGTAPLTEGGRCPRVLLENTQKETGGRALPLDWLDEVSEGFSLRFSLELY